jgi:hypothetical protein
LHLPAQNLGTFVGILFPATVTPNVDFVRQHRKRGIRVCLTQQDAMLIPDIAPVVKSAILADNNPKVVSCVFHTFSETTHGNKIGLHYATLRGMHVKSGKYITLCGRS